MTNDASDQTLPVHAGSLTPEKDGAMTTRKVCFAASVMVLLATSSAGVASPPDHDAHHQPKSAVSRSGLVAVANEGNGSISIVDAMTSAVVTTISGIDGPHNLQITPDGSEVWVTSAPHNVVVAITLADYSLRGIVRVGQHPAHVVFTPDGSRAFVTNSGDNTLSVIDAADLHLVRTLPIGKMPHGARVSGDGRWVAVANMESGTVSVLDADSLDHVADVAVGARPVQVGFAPDESALFVSLNGSDEVARIETATWAITATSPSGPGPIQVYASPDGKILAVANQGTEEKPGNSLALFDATTLRPGPVVQTGAGAHGVVITPDSRYAYVTNVYADTVSVVDLTAGVTVATVPVGDAPNGLSFSAAPPAKPHSKTIELDFGDGLEVIPHIEDQEDSDDAHAH